MPTVVYVLGAFAAVSFGLMVFGLAALVMPARQAKRLERHLESAVRATGLDLEAADRAKASSLHIPTLVLRLVAYARRLDDRAWFRALVRYAARPERERRLKHKLDQAGWGFEFTVQEFVGAQLVAAVVLLGVTLAYLLALDAEPMWWLGLFVVPVVGFRMTEATISSQIDARQRRIRLDLPRSVDILVVALEAGLTLDKAIQLYCERFSGPLAQEFLKVEDEINVGRRRRDALMDMAERTGVADVALLASAILQAERFGVPVAQVLQSQSADLKVRRNQYIREQTLKAPVKMLLPITIFILPALLCVMLGPLVIKFMGGGLF